MDHHDAVPMLMDKEAYLPLWTIKEEDESNTSRTRPKKSRLPSMCSLISHLLVVTIYTTVFILFSSIHERSPSVYSPAREVLSYMPKTISVLYNDTTNLFLQESGEGVSKAWHDLLQNLNIRLNKEEMTALGRDSVQLNDGTGDYLASLDVYHQLHCLKFLRSYIDENPLTAIRVQPKSHAYHCIELLRQVIQCHGDVSVLTYDWLPEDKTPMPRWEIEHECVDWEALDSWAAERRVNLMGNGMVLHPEHGHV